MTHRSASLVRHIRLLLSYSVRATASLQVTGTVGGRLVGRTTRMAVGHGSFVRSAFLLRFDNRCGSGTTPAEITRRLSLLFVGQVHVILPCRICD